MDVPLILEALAAAVHIKPSKHVFDAHYAMLVAAARRSSA